MIHVDRTPWRVRPPRRLSRPARAMAALLTAIAIGWCALGTARSQPLKVLAPTVDILHARTREVDTTDGTVSYRQVGSGSPLLLIMGLGGSMDYWPPTFIDALAGEHTVLVVDNAGVGSTAAVRGSLTITAMANQLSALITSLHLHRPAVLGWSMGGMIAQALAVLHPDQVSALILAATQAGTGTSRPIPPGPASIVAGPDPLAALSVVFPHNQIRAARVYLQHILQYEPFYAASAHVKVLQTAAIHRWMSARDRAGRDLDRVRVPTLVADGTLDELDPSSNDRLLARVVQHARLILYRDAGHAFLFQDAQSFELATERFLRSAAGDRDMPNASTPSYASRLRSRERARRWHGELLLRRDGTLGRCPR